ncbi:MAG: DUF427 domain-containing protein [Deltaproteobacteria bacterium]|nr:DUF427 domain-containing protein [Deltaproteobacteria bacterium]
MPKATWNGVVLAQSDDTIQIEGNHYFPQQSLNLEYFRPSEEHTVCPWKGQASYFDVVANGKENPGAAWFYPEPKQAAQPIKGRVAFWKGVRIED